MLTKQAIIDAIKAGEITYQLPEDMALLVPNPIDLDQVCGPNSIDFHLGEGMLLFCGFEQNRTPVYKPVPIAHTGGYHLQPGKTYLGCTKEVVGSTHYVPTLHGRSSLARMGISLHHTAGFGDLGFAGQWTLEITVTEPTELRPGDRIGQFCFHPAVGDRSTQYQGGYRGKTGPVPSKGFSK